MKHFDRIRTQLDPELTAMNSIIRETLATSNPLLNRIVETYLQSKGKQIRPMLVILAAKMLGSVNDHVLHAGAALEMLHNASLIHDDVVDETKIRRGLPTINANWDNHIAVLVGDFFVSNALSAGVKTGVITVVSALSELGKELSLGEIEQIGNVREHHFDEGRYFSMIRKKTASLFRNCVKLGAETSGATPDQYAPLVEYAEILGICFQIKDDIFDYFESKEIGKPTGNDLREGKVTLPLLHALEVAPKVESDKMKQMLIADNLDDAQIRVLIDFAKAYGGIDYAFAKMRELQQQADEIIARYPESESRTMFRDIFDFIISRPF